MRNLIAAILGLAFGGALGVGALYLDEGPKSHVVLPDSRYSPSAISSAIVAEAQDFTVLISNEGLDGMSRGTGVLVDSMTVLTCAHMLPEDRTTNSMWIYPYPGAQIVHARLKFVNYPNDLALLELTTPVLGHKTPIFAPEATIGESIVVVGNINGYMMWFVSGGVVSGKYSKWMLTDAVIHGGNSGGPWVNARGEIVALTDVGWNDRSGHNVGISGGVPTKTLQRFLAQAKLREPSLIYILTGE